MEAINISRSMAKTLIKKGEKMEQKIIQGIIILSASQYQIKADNGVVENEGCTVRYIATDNLSRHEDVVRPTKGYAPAKATIPYDDFKQIIAAPAMYECAFEMKVDSKGKVSMVPSAFKLIGELTVSLNRPTGNETK